MPPSRRSQFNSTVVANVPLCREHFRLVLRVEGFPLTEPGQFIQIACHDQNIEDSVERQLDWAEGSFPKIEGRESESPVAFLRRPFSLAGRRDSAGATELDIIHRVVGVGTDWLARLEPGDTVEILGPLGNRFQLPPAGGTALLVGGGVGIPPMLYLAEVLGRQGIAGVAFCGALTRDLLPLKVIDAANVPGPDRSGPRLIIDEFARHGIPSVVSTDDGSLGFRGFVTQAIERYLNGSGFHVQPAVPGSVTECRSNGVTGCAPSQSALRHSDTPSLRHNSSCPILYTCGPEPMMKRVAAIAAERGLECQIAVERAMACGMGTCQSCVIRVRIDGPSSDRWAYRLACTDGPVFAGADLLW